MDPEVIEAPVDRGDDLFPETLEPEVKTDPADAAAEDLTSKLEEEKTEAEEKDKRKDSRIPLARHKEILEKEREQRANLERQLAQYQQGGQVADFNAEITAAENAITALWKEYNTLLTDGEIDKAAAKQTEITRTERQMAEAKSDMKIHAAEIRATERARYNTALERVEAAFPTLNPDHDDYDADVMAEVADLKSAYEMKGLTPTVALQKAVKALVEPRTTRQEMATTTKPQVSEKDVAAERKTAAVEKVVKTVGKQPPSLNKVGLDSDKMGGGSLDPKAIMNMSQKEFAALSEETLSKMRGDTI